MQSFRNISWLDIEKNAEKPIFYQISSIVPRLPKNHILCRKSGFLTFFLLLTSNFMPSFRNIYRIVLEKNPKTIFFLTILPRLAQNQIFSGLNSNFTPSFSKISQLVFEKDLENHIFCRIYIRWNTKETCAPSFRKQGVKNRFLVVK